MATAKPILPLACLLLCACTNPRPPADASGADTTATPVTVAAVRSEPIRHLITLEAVLYPIRQATVMPKISAPVARFFVERGTHVHRGQLLAVLEDRDLVAAAKENKELYLAAQANLQMMVAATLPDDLTKARADLAASRQALDTAQKIFDSRSRLLREGALAQRQVDDARLTLAQAQSAFETARAHLTSLQSAGQPDQKAGAEAQAAAAKAHYEGAAAQLSYAEVRSPLSGVVSDRPVNVGEMSTGGAALLSVVDISRVVARANLPVNQAAQLSVGRPAVISGAGVALQGRVTVVSPAVDPNTTTVQVWVEAANPSERLKLGTTVEVSVDAGEIPDATVIPSAAILSTGDGGEKVMVAGPDSLAHERPIQVGIRTGADAQVVSGLKAGESVIIDGALGLDDKARIAVGNSPAGANSARRNGPR